MTRVTRRQVLKSGAAVAGGMAGILATGRAPAFAQGTTVHWLRWNDFVPASDQLLRKELLPAAEKDLGIKVNLETVNGNRELAAKLLGLSPATLYRMMEKLGLKGYKHQPSGSVAYLYKENACRSYSELRTFCFTLGKRGRS